MVAVGGVICTTTDDRMRNSHHKYHVVRLRQATKLSLQASGVQLPDHPASTAAQPL